MVTTASKVAIIKATLLVKVIIIIGSTSNELYLVKGNHQKLFSIAKEKHLRCRCDTRCDTNK